MKEKDRDKKRAVGAAPLTWLLSVLLICAALVLLPQAVAATGSGKARSSGKATYRYAINLVSSEKPVDLSAVSGLGSYKKYNLYTTRHREGKKRWYRLRLGFFPNKKEAEKALRRLRGRFREAWVVRVSTRERTQVAARRSTGSSSTARKATSAAKTSSNAPVKAEDSVFDKSIKKLKKGVNQTIAFIDKGVGKITDKISPSTPKKDKKEKKEKKDKKEKPVSTRKTTRKTTSAAKTKSGAPVKAEDSVFDKSIKKLKKGVNQTIAFIDKGVGKITDKISPSTSKKDKKKRRVSARKDSKGKEAGSAVRTEGGRFKFQHFNTGFPLTGGHTSVKCEGCHTRGLFTNTPTRCEECHSQGGSVTASTKPTDHIPTRAACDQCHRDQGWSIAHYRHIAESFGQCSTCHNGATAPGKSPAHVSSSNTCDECHTTSSWTSARFDHGSVTGSCSSCHNGGTATGKPATHVSSSNTCDECHSTNGWAGARFDHGSVSGSCSTCHNGATATGKPATHISSSNTCDECHTTSGWAGARFDHGSVSGSCSTCHNGATATGKPSTHISSSNICDECHTTSSWASANFDHGSVTGSCNSCHNGTTATGKPSKHFVTSVQCDECHTTSGWTSQITYRHSAGNYPGDHNSSVKCLDCHTNNSQTISWSYASYKPDCAACHAGKYKKSKHTKVSGSIKYTVSELRDCAGSCHKYTDSSLTTISKTRNSKHRASKGGW